MEEQSVPRIAVLYGGIGSEREISLISGKAVLKALEGYAEHPVLGVQLDVDDLPDEMRAATDIVIPVLHGEFGEDGAIQRELDAAGFVFCGSDAQSSALCMDKERTKALLEEDEIPVVPGYGYIGKPEIPEEEIISILGEYIVAKPVAMGSSIGLRLLKGADQLSGFLKEKACDPGGWLLEKRIFGREFSVGVLEGRAMGIVEIEVPEGRVYDYEQKYCREDTRYHCPADLNPEVTRRVQDYAERVFSICGCRDYARIDFLLETVSDDWFCLELNTIPGMTPSSLLPKSAGAVGLDFRQLLLRMMAPAITRFRERLTIQNLDTPQITGFENNARFINSPKFRVFFLLLCRKHQNGLTFHNPDQQLIWEILGYFSTAYLPITLKHMLYRVRIEPFQIGGNEIHDPLADCFLGQSAVTGNDQIR